MTINLKRAYESPHFSDGFRILIDRLWPRGVSKKQLQLDVWLKEIAPSTELRKWFNHNPKKFELFSKRYRQELMNNEETVQELISYTKEHSTITLIYAAKDQQYNNAVVLKDFVEETS